MSEQVTIKWPPLDVAYTDEFGDIDADVYTAAGVIWPRAERIALRVLHDPAAGQRLLVKAAARVSHARAQQDQQIDHLEAYLFQTYRRLVLAQSEKNNARRRREVEMMAYQSVATGDVPGILEQKLLVGEILEKLDDRTQLVLRLLIMDHTFEEIGRMLKANPHTIRITFRRQVRRVVGQLKVNLKFKG